MFRLKFLLALCIYISPRWYWKLYKSVPLCFLQTTLPRPWLPLTQKELVEFNTTTQLPIKLNSSNYPAWYRQIHSLLVARDLDGYVTGTTRCPVATITTADVCCLILHLVYLALLGPTAPTSRDAWPTLVRAFASCYWLQFMQNVPQRAFELHQKGIIQCCCILADHTFNCRELSLIGHPVDDIYLVNYALNGLDQTFWEFTASIRTRDTHITFDEPFIKLTDYEMCLMLGARERKNI